MISRNRERVKELLDQAARLAPALRPAFIEQAVGGDRKVAAEALELLQTLDDSGFLSAPTAAAPAAIAGLASAANAGLTATAATTRPLSEGPGTRIDRYKLLQQIGEGGFGTVFMAEQTEPVVRRVALKIIKAGMDTRQVIARFEAERQALALMDHPNIARVLDAGATDSGRPYFVMELVKGEPVTKYCDREQLSVPRRLELFRDVCHAVEHAHQKGVIHRDLKPSNVLVTVADAQPIPKVIDFGIAKATASKLTEKTFFTEMHQLIGTPEYMSPEQAEPASADIDTRSDVYSLGVLLYELLTGTTPLDPRKLLASGIEGLIRIIREEEPPRPSLRLETLASSSGRVRLATPVEARDDSQDSSAIEIARRRRSEPPALTRALRGDLDWIAMKCLEKDRRRRYETASALAQDIERYLAHEPVAATPPSPGYKLRKFVRRNRTYVLAGGLLATAMVLGLVGTTWGVFWALDERARARNEANNARQAEAEQRRLADAESTARAVADERRAAEERQRRRAETINQFMANALGSADPRQGGQQDARIADAMILAIRKLDTGVLKDDPQTVADLRTVIATILLNNGRAAEAEPLFVQALEMRQRLFEGDHPDVATGLHNLAWSREMLHRPAEAEALYLQALEMRQQLFTSDHPDIAQTLNRLAWLRRGLGRLAEAELLFDQALEMCQRLFPGDHPQLAASLNGVARVRQQRGRLAEAELLYVQAVEMYQRLLPGDHPDVASTLKNLGWVRWDLGRPAEAERLFVQALEMRQRMYAGDHMYVAVSLHELGFLLNSQGRSSEALPKYEAALAMARRVGPAGNSSMLHAQIGLASTLVALGRFAEAEPLLIDSAEHCERSEDSRQRCWQGVLETSVKLYDAWHAAEPDKGYDAQAAEWRDKLAEWQATTQPAAAQSGASQPATAPP